MNADAIRAIADAVLYEGYILYPYRPSSVKNRQRWTFGGVFPQAFSEASGSDPWTLKTECLVEGGAELTVSVRLRFLHLVERKVLAFDPTTDGEAAWRSVASLQVGETQFIAWEEAVEREVEAPWLAIADLVAAPRRVAFAFPESCERELLHSEAGRLAGAIVRTGRAIAGALIVSAARARSDQTPPLPSEDLGEGRVRAGSCEGIAPDTSPRALDVTSGASPAGPHPTLSRDAGDEFSEHWRLSVRVENLTALAPEDGQSRALAQPSALISTHLILGVEGGAFLSLTDPPDEAADEAAACVNQGLWPVLVGAARDAMLASPIILPDQPQIAPESPGDLFDGTEIDEILTLRILTMTDAEKAEAAAADPRARALLARTEALTPGEMARLHGALRSPRAFPKPTLAAVSDGGAELAVGDRVRLKPKAGGDIMDLALAGKIAVVEAIERDFEDRTHVAVTIEDDPGRDLGLGRFPGHRFFFSREELIPLGDEPSEREAAP